MKNTIFLLSLLLASTITFADKKSRLELNLAKGGTYYMNTQAVLNVIQKIDGQQMKTQASVGGVMSFKVKNKTNNIYELESMYESMSFKMEMMDSIMFDVNTTNTDTNKIMDRIFYNMTKIPITIFMEKNGKVKEIKDLENIYANMFKGLPLISHEQRVALNAQLQQSFGPEALKGSIELVTAIYPDGEVTKGDSWNCEVHMKSIISTDFDVNYRLSENAKGYTTIKGEGKMKTTDDNDYIPQNGMLMKYDLAGNYIADIKIDNETGWPFESQIQQILKGDIFIKESETSITEIKVPVIFNIKTTNKN